MLTTDERDEMKYPPPSYVRVAKMSSRELIRQFVLPQKRTVHGMIWIEIQLRLTGAVKGGAK